MTRLLTLTALVPLALGACTNLQPSRYQHCYADEECSEDTPLGLEFRGTDITGQLGGLPGPLAIGGTGTVTVLDPTDDLTNAVPFELPYSTDTSRLVDGRFPRGVEVVEQDGNEITVRGIGAGYNYLRLLSPDGELYDRTSLGAQKIDHLQVRPPYAYDGPSETETVVWAPGAHDVTVGLWSAPHPELANTSDLLVDESLTLTLPGATQIRWDTIHVPAAPAGHRDLTVVGGSAATVLDIETVEAPDTIVNASGNYYPLSIYGSTRLCFVARHQGRYVAGATWSFAMDGGEVLRDAEADPTSGCAYFAARDQGTIRIHATASGYTQTLDVTAQ